MLCLDFFTDKKCHGLFLFLYRQNEYQDRVVKGSGKVLEVALFPLLVLGL